MYADSVLSEVLPREALDIAIGDQQKGIPAIAKDLPLVDKIEKALLRLPTNHRLVCADSREIRAVKNETVDLAVTSPPYWTLKKYPDRQGQMGDIVDYEDFLDALDKVWRKTFKLLVPGGRLIIVVGDVCLPRRSFGRHVVFPLHASIQDRCRKIGFDNLAPIIWHKIANAKYEAGGNSGFLGKPYEPNSVIKNDIEYILFQRKPGGYRQPSLATRVASVISTKNHKEWFQQIWTIPGASTKKHPAPYPLTLAERLIRMYSFVGDTVLDPFMGTGTTNVAASLWGRNSIGFEIEPGYLKMASERLRDSGSGLWPTAHITVE